MRPTRRAWSLVAEMLDAACWSVLAAAGCSPVEARQILARLWVTNTTAGAGR